MSTSSATASNARTNTPHLPLSGWKVAGAEGFGAHLDAGTTFEPARDLSVTEWRYRSLVFAESELTGHLLRELRVIAEIGLRQMAIRTHFSPAYLSQIENGKRPVPPGVAEAYRRVLGADPVVGKFTTAAADPASAGVSDVADILARTRRLEDRLGAGAVAPVVRGLDGIARTLDFALASEVARYRGWLEHAVGRRVVADKVLQDAATMAQDGQQRAHALSFRSLTARHDGDLNKALALADASLAEDGVHPAIRAFDRYWRAELLARLGERRTAAKELASDPPESDELPAGGYWYTPGFLAVQRGLVLSCMGREDDGVDEAVRGLSEMPDAHRGTDWINTMLAQVAPGLRDEIPY
ncbi:helix-turn-helix transcriptional regulator [Nocardia sp. NRRL WC-3656]|uniref:helix-turn-helix domain-containing protein n=1 Tax=Nocardia sp. NRRL WC-3656 TaxID=1463824 RepID=UPI001E4CF5DF|nr:helix-turn-helix transcriptional regulator [Nocardia sp. NRRL WC-3656]